MRERPPALLDAPDTMPRVGWSFVYMMVVLKIPLLALLWLVWWSIRAEPAPAEADGETGGGGRRHPRPRRPRPPRRGPHAGTALAAPVRNRFRSNARAREARPARH